MKAIGLFRFLPLLAAAIIPQWELSGQTATLTQIVHPRYRDIGGELFDFEPVIEARTPNYLLKCRVITSNGVGTLLLVHLGYDLSPRRPGVLNYLAASKLNAKGPVSAGAALATSQNFKATPIDEEVFVPDLKNLPERETEIVAMRGGSKKVVVSGKELSYPCYFYGKPVTDISGYDHLTRVMPNGVVRVELKEHVAKKYPKERG